MDTLRLSGIAEESIVDGPGLRYTIFTQGCPHGCPGCHNPQTHDFSGGYLMQAADILAEIDKRPYIKGITFSGGEPFCQSAALFGLASELKKRGKHLMAYTGYTFEQLLALKDCYVRPLLTQLDLLVDGRFELQQRSLSLKFRGSTNQRILDVQSSLTENAAVWAEQYR